MKALAKDRTLRYETANGFAFDIKRYLNDEPVVACPPSLTYRFKKSVHRNRLLIGVASVISLTLLVSCAICVWQVIEARRAQRASMVRERQAKELLEAARLQTAMDAFGQKDLVRLAAVTTSLPQDEPGVEHAFAESGSLAGLLRAAAIPLPQRSFTHSAAVQEVAVSADGKRAVSVDIKGTVRLWDLSAPESGQVLGTHSEQADAVAISPDGTRAVTGSTTGQVWFWDLEQGDVQRQLSPLNTGVEALAWSPDGQYVAAGARYSEIWVGDADGQQLFRIKNDHRHEALLFSPDSKQLFVPTRQGIDVWELASRKRRTFFSTNLGFNARALCWAGPQLDWLVTGERFSESLEVVHRKTGKRLGTVVTGVAYAQCLAASSDGKWLAAAYADGCVQVIRLSGSASDGVAGKVHLQFSAHHSEEARSAVAWIADSERFVTAGEDGRVNVWDLNRLMPIRVLEPPTPMIFAYPIGLHELVYYFSGRTGNGDRPFRGNYFGETHSQPGRKIPFPIQAFVHHPARDMIAVAGANQIEIVSLESGHAVGKIPSPFGIHQQLAISPDATAVATSSHDGQICVWRTSDRWVTHEKAGTWLMKSLSAPVFADDGRTLIVDDDWQAIVEWNVDTIDVLRKHPITNTSSYCVSNRGDLLAAATERGIRVWNRVTGDICLQVGNLSDTATLRFIQDDRVLVSGHEDGRIRAWHVPTGLELGVLFDPDQPLGKPESILVPDDGNRLLIWYRDERGLRLVVLGLEPPFKAASSVTTVNGVAAR